VSVFRIKVDFSRRKSAKKFLCAKTVGDVWCRVAYSLPLTFWQEQTYPTSRSVCGNRPLSQRAAIAKMSWIIYFCYYRTLTKFNVLIYFKGKGQRGNKGNNKRTHNNQI